MPARSSNKPSATTTQTHTVDDLEQVESDADDHGAPVAIDRLSRGLPNFRGAVRSTKNRPIAPRFFGPNHSHPSRGTYPHDMPAPLSNKPSAETTQTYTAEDLERVACEAAERGARLALARPANDVRRSSAVHCGVVSPIVVVDIDTLRALLREVLAEQTTPSAAPAYYSQTCLPPGMTRRAFLDAIRRGDLPAKASGKMRIVAREDYQAFVEKASSVAARGREQDMTEGDILALVRASQGK